MSLHGDGTVGHGTGDEAADDLVPWLDLFDGDGVGILIAEIKETTEVNRLSLLISVLRVRLVSLFVLLTDGVLEVRDAVGVVDVSLTTSTPVILARLRHSGRQDGLARWPATLVHLVGVHS